MAHVLPHIFSNKGGGFLRSVSYTNCVGFALTLWANIEFDYLLRKDVYS